MRGHGKAVNITEQNKCAVLGFITDMRILQGGVEGGRVWLPQGHSRGDPVPVQKKKVCVCVLARLCPVGLNISILIFKGSFCMFCWQDDRAPWTSEAGNGELVQDSFKCPYRPHALSKHCLLLMELGWHQWRSCISALFHIVITENTNINEKMYWALWDVSALDASSLCGDWLFEEHGGPGSETKPPHLDVEGNTVTEPSRCLAALHMFCCSFLCAADGGVCRWIFWPEPHQSGMFTPWDCGLWGLKQIESSGFCSAHFKT